MGNFIDNLHDDYDRFGEINLNEEKKGRRRQYLWRGRTSNTNKKISTQKYTINKQRDKNNKAPESAICITNWNNHNFNISQTELTRCHFRLVNIVLQYVKWIFFTGCLKVQVNAKAVANCENNKCYAYYFRQGKCQSNKRNTTNKNYEKYQDLKKDHIWPIKMVSADHHILRTPRNIYNKRGKSAPSEMCVL